jgi:hypothetical protein
MFRLVSFFALACLSLAATALLTASKSSAEEQPRGETNNAEATNRLSAQTGPCIVPFHARFSLN